MMEDFTLLYKILFSIGVGFLIGLEREYKAKQTIFAGVRTFPLITLLGMLSSFVYDKYWDGILFVSFIGIVLFVLLNFYMEYSEDKGITTEVSVLIAFIVGILIYYEQYYNAAFIGIVLMFILAIKKPVEDFAKHLYYEDIISIIKFLMLTVLVYPILPDRYFGPYDFFNPKEIWKVVIIVAVIDFLGYFLLRWKGQRSLLMVGFLGGLVSSTAVTYNFSKLSKKISSANIFLGIALAWSVMNLRVLFLSGIVNFELLKFLAIPFLVLTFIYWIILYRDFKKDKMNQKVEYEELRNPFSVFSIMQFGAIYVFIVFLAKVLSYHFGNMGLYTLSMVSGVIDVDAIVLSSSNMARAGFIEQTVAISSIFLAVISNSIFKYIYVYIFADVWLKSKMFFFLIFTLMYMLTCMIIISLIF